MKLSLSTVITLACVSSANAFAPKYSSSTTYNRQVCQGMVNNDSQISDERMNRRGALSSIVAGGSVFLMGGQAASAKPPPQTYLTEPTDEFKESERQRMEFRQKQFKLKGEMQAVLDRIVIEDNNPEALKKDLEALQDVVVKIGGMPLGIKKDDLVKQVRSRKAKGPWPTECEYA